jgi:putative glutamine amidotransferase
MPLPVIGICAATELASWGAWRGPAHLLPQEYALAVQRAGGLALLLPADPRAAGDPSPWLDLLDGLLLAGGTDVDPATYGATERHPTVVHTDPARDGFELALTRGAIARDLPVLGICRGMQLLNVARGGTLLQHVPEALGHGEHRRTLGSFEGADHSVLLSPGSLAARAAGEEDHRTLSHHHQAVDALGDGLVVSGRAEMDELPEAIELPGARWVLGVQWHPEVDETSRLLHALVEAAGRPAGAAQGAPG